MMPSNHKTIDVRVKPYVRQYLINNCGNPVDLNHMPKFKSLFKRLLHNSCLRFESLQPPQNECYVSIIVSNDSFYRYGWEMSKANMMIFNAEVENDIKFVMRNFISTYSTFYSIATCIRMFQDRFNFPEDVWKYDAIDKDIERNSTVKKSKMVQEFIDSFDKRLMKVFVENLSTVGTLSKKYKNELSEIYQ